MRDRILFSMALFALLLPMGGFAQERSGRSEFPSLDCDQLVYGDEANRHVDFRPYDRAISGALWNDYASVYQVTGRAGRRSLAIVHRADPENRQVEEEWEFVLLDSETRKPNSNYFWRVVKYYRGDWGFRADKIEDGKRVARFACLEADSADRR